VLQKLNYPKESAEANHSGQTLVVVDVRKMDIAGVCAAAIGASKPLRRALLPRTVSIRRKKRSAISLSYVTRKLERKSVKIA
jgi:hypothetical protein